MLSPAEQAEVERLELLRTAKQRESVAASFEAIDGVAGAEARSLALFEEQVALEEQIRAIDPLWRPARQRLDPRLSQC